ncbi:hypothetical protein [Roseateles oligotrophus]|uniref:Uncharacterized protein n=1 Tax=Roseateles oligotrophus TaxID=1769250 RepID=A0ABT2YE79_9BURK|nr:hypothetical protein [Roseateles oligotrophus]MCV2368326.1 hypothetical protein [Roseateles oligotrophus]
MAEIEKNNFNPEVSRYISMAIREVEVDWQEINTEPVSLEQATKDARDKHYAFFKALGLPALP